VPERLLAAPPDVRDDDPPVTTVMTPTVIAVDTTTDVGAALREMARHGVRHLVVRTGDRADGAVTEAAVVRAIADDRTTTPVGALRVPLPRLGTSGRRSDAARLMVDQRVDAVLVTTDGTDDTNTDATVAGIVTATDILQSLAGR
jgi:CBS domain-containing protein